MSRAVRAAMLKASVANVTVCADIDEREDRWLTQAPVADVRNVLDELERLQKVEARIKARIAEQEERRAKALEQMRKLRDVWEIERALEFERKASRYLDKIVTLEEMLDA